MRPFANCRSVKRPSVSRDSSAIAFLTTAGASVLTAWGRASAMGARAQYSARSEEMKERLAISRSTSSRRLRGRSRLRGVGA